MTDQMNTLPRAVRYRRLLTAEIVSTAAPVAAMTVGLGVGLVGWYHATHSQTAWAAVAVAALVSATLTVGGDPHVRRAWRRIVARHREARQ